MSHLRVVGGKDVGWTAVGVSMANTTQPTLRAARKQRDWPVAVAWTAALMFCVAMWAFAFAAVLDLFAPA